MLLKQNGVRKITADLSSETEKLLVSLNDRMFIVISPTHVKKTYIQKKLYSLYLNII